jgi:hypothetical protein
MYVITDSSLHMRHFTWARTPARTHTHTHTLTHSLTHTHHPMGITRYIDPFIILYVHITSDRGLLYLIIVPLETVVLDRKISVLFFCPGK